MGDGCGRCHNTEWQESSVMPVTSNSTNMAWVPWRESSSGARYDGIAVRLEASVMSVRLEHSSEAGKARVKRIVAELMLKSMLALSRAPLLPSVNTSVTFH